MSPWRGRVDHEYAAPLFALSPYFSYLLTIAAQAFFFLFSFIPVCPDPRYERDVSWLFFRLSILRLDPPAGSLRSALERNVLAHRQRFYQARDFAAPDSLPQRCSHRKSDLHVPFHTHRPPPHRRCVRLELVLLASSAATRYGCCCCGCGRSCRYSCVARVLLCELFANERR